MTRPFLISAVVAIKDYLLEFKRAAKLVKILE
jgi:hypothetical protein